MASTVKQVAKTAVAMRRDTIAAIQKQQEQLVKLEALLEGLAPTELAKAATKPAIRYALEVIEDSDAQADARLRATALILNLGHAQAPKVVDMGVKVDTVRTATPEAVRASALALVNSTAIEQ